MVFSIIQCSSGLTPHKISGVCQFLEKHVKQSVSWPPSAFWYVWQSAKALWLFFHLKPELIRVLQ